MDGDGDGVERPRAGRSFFGPDHASLSAPQARQLSRFPADHRLWAAHTTKPVVFSSPSNIIAIARPTPGRADSAAGRQRQRDLLGIAFSSSLYLSLSVPSLHLSTLRCPSRRYFTCKNVRTAVRACTYGRILRKVEYIPHPHRLGCRVGFLLSRTAYGGLASSEVSGICKDG